VDGDGMVAVVDFSGEVRRLQDLENGGNRPGYEGWGRITDVPRPVSVDVAQGHPVLKGLFTGSIQGAWSLTADEAQAISDCAGGLPRAPSFEGFEPDWDEESGDWGRYRLPPEAIVERIVLDKDRVARKLGFPSGVISQQHLSNGRRPDLWCADGVVGEVKNQVTARWGPDQIEDYIEQCDRQWPAHRWRGVLVQGEPDMAPNALPRLKSSRYRRRLEVWAVQKESAGHITVDQLFP
jgi:hypothetical protein